MKTRSYTLKLFNYRPFVLIFLSLICGVLVANFITPNTIITIICTCIGISIVLLYTFWHKTAKYLSIVCIMFVLGFCAYTVYINSRTHNISNQANKTAIGTVEKITTYDNCLALLIKDLKIENKKQNYNASVYYHNTNQLGYIKLYVGAKIKFKVDEHTDAEIYGEDNLPHTYYLKNNIGAIFSTSAVEVIGKECTFRTKTLTKIRNNLRLGLNNSNGEMIYSAMFGDKTDLNHELYDAYKMSGVAHLLAVSGLHIGLVVAIICWILNKLRVKNWLKVLIVGALLLVYAYLCNFSYSVIRASIMAMVLLVAPVLFSEYDLLSSISFAGCLILIIEPIALFDLSAMLSFGCVLGITILYSGFQRLLSRIPIKKSIKDSFCISASTLIGTLTIMAYYFGYIQPIALISNIILIPAFSILFTITFILAMCSVVFPAICYTLGLINPLFECLNWVIILIAGVSRSLIIPQINYITILEWFIVLAFASKYCLKQGIVKLSIVSTLVSMLAIQLVLI